jgi:hypothetical protein
MNKLNKCLHIPSNKYTHSLSSFITLWKNCHIKLFNWLSILPYPQTALITQWREHILCPHQVWQSINEKNSCPSQELIPGCPAHSQLLNSAIPFKLKGTICHKMLFLSPSPDHLTPIKLLNAISNLMFMKVKILQLLAWTLFLLNIMSPRRFMETIKSKPP